MIPSMRAPRRCRLASLRLCGALLLGAAASTVLCTPPASARPASDVSKAKDLFKAGARAYKLGRFGAAAKAFEQAYAIVPKPELRFSAAQALRRQYRLDRKVEHLRTARQYYEDYLKLVKQGGRRADAAEGLEAVEAELREHAPEPAPSDGGEGGGAVTAPAEPAQPEPADPRPTLMVDALVAGTETKSAKISVDGGKPLPIPFIEPVATGEHRIRITKPGYQPIEATIRVLPNEQFQSHKFPLEELPSKLTVSGVDGAEVLVDGRPVGLTPITTPVKLSSGEHQIVVGLNGHERFDQTVVLGRGETEQVDVELEMTSQRVAAWVSIGVGAAAAAAGVVLVVFRAINNNEARTIHDATLGAEPQMAMTYVQADDYNGYLETRDDFDRWATTTFVGASIGLALGLILYILDEPQLYGAAPEGDDAEDESPEQSPDDIAVHLGPAPPGSFGTGLRLRF